MKSLVVVESPAKAKTISRFLGKDYVVEACYGHVRDLPSRRAEVPEEVRNEPWADFGVNTDHDFEPVYVIPAEKKRHIETLKKALRTADQLLLATDEDREGESISWHLLEVLKPKVPVKRIVFHEITREAIEEAIQNPRDLDENLVRAQEGRRILDRLFGYELSPVLWRKVQQGLSAGRVQSSAVRLIVEREEERGRFRSAEFWDLEAEIAAGNHKFKATLSAVAGRRIATGKDFDPATGRLGNEKVAHLDAAMAHEMVGRLREALPWRVDSVERSPATQRPSPPFTTSTLQQEANRKLGMGARRIMQIAQHLYEGVDLGGGERVGLITYMRTDSVNLSQKALNDTQKVIKQLFGDEYAQGPRFYKTKTANAQEAHEAIRPTEVSRRPQDVAAYLERDQLALYELIWKRTLASQMPEAQLIRTAVSIIATGPKGDAVFTATGKQIKFPGFLRAYVEGQDDPNAELGDQEVILPEMREGQLVVGQRGSDHLATAPVTNGDLSLTNLLEKRHETVPPARYTEASLVKKLEEEGIGRPSTYATIIGTIQDRGYVFINKSRQLVPTFIAMVVMRLLRDHFGHYVDLKFTARMEEELDQVASGERSWIDHISNFYRGSDGEPGLRQVVQSTQAEIERPEIIIGDDPETGNPVRVRVGKYGPYLAQGTNGANGSPEDMLMADLPADVAPADFTIEDAVEALRRRKSGPRLVGTDSRSGLAVYVATGRYGDYVQLGETPEEKTKGTPKPKRASLESGMSFDTVTMADALRLLSLPRELGAHPETGEPVISNNGRFGPYVNSGSDFRSIKPPDNVFEITLERALELLAQPKAPRGGARQQANALRELGEGIRLMDGRYGPYVTDGKTNATLPKTTSVDDVTLDQAKVLIAERAASGKGGKKTARTRAAAAPKTSAAKPRAKAKPAAAKAPKAKPAARKAAPKSTKKA